MAYKVIILYRLYMPSYFLGTFTEYPYFANCFRECFSVFTRMTAGCLTGESGETDRKQTQKGADKNTESEYLNALRVLSFFYGSSLFPETRRKHQQNAEQFQTPYQHKERRQPFSCIRQRIP